MSKKDSDKVKTFRRTASPTGRPLSEKEARKQRLLEIAEGAQDTGAGRVTQRLSERVPPRPSTPPPMPAIPPPSRLPTFGPKDGKK